MTGTGKSTIARRLFKTGYVYDINGEYGDQYHDIFSEDIDSAIEKMDQLRGVNIIIEEATLFFNSRSSIPAPLRRMIIGKRHRGINIGMIFHMLTDIPDALFSMADMVVLLRTNERPEKIRAKFKGADEYLEAFNSLKSANRYAYMILGDKRDFSYIKE